MLADECSIASAIGPLEMVTLSPGLEDSTTDGGAAA
jgi:hypothetical protein